MDLLMEKKTEVIQVIERIEWMDHLFLVDIIQVYSSKTGTPTFTYGISYRTLTLLHPHRSEHRWPRHKINFMVTFEADAWFYITLSCA